MQQGGMEDTWRDLCTEIEYLNAGKEEIVLGAFIEGFYQKV